LFQQINDTKSAYTQITDLVSNQFTDDNVSNGNEVNGTYLLIIPQPQYNISCQRICNEIVTLITYYTYYIQHIRHFVNIFVNYEF
jgi:hypothetical protein